MIPKEYSKLNKAKSLRKDMTPQERHLWYDFLRYYPVKIYKQRIIGPYIVDFYCASAKLVIEIDGSQHYKEQGQLRDVMRQFYKSTETAAVGCTFGHHTAVKLVVAIQNQT